MAKTKQSQGFQKSTGTPMNPTMANVKPPLGNEVVKITQERRSGPLPEPEDLAGYDKIVPGAANRILAMAEGQNAHRQAMENRSLELDGEAMRRGYSESRWGQVFAFIVVMSVVLAGVWIVMFRDVMYGSAILLGVGLVSIVGKFLAKAESADSGQS
jgi:uncharacterized membrane protein